MDLSFTPALLLAGCWFLIVSTQAKGQNVSEVMEDDSLLPAKERFRRLIPYMTYYLDQGYDTQNQYVNSNLQQYQPVQPVSNGLPVRPYYNSQYQQQKYQLVPVGYLVGGGYRQVPVYSRPTQTDYSSLSYTPQNPSDLTRMITQNYLAIAKQMSNIHKNQRPAQLRSKIQNVNEHQQQNQIYKPQTYVQRYQQNSPRQPYILKSFRPQYTTPKDDSYVQLHSNYEPTYVSTQNKNYEPDPDVMTITKSQEITFPAEEYQESIPISTTSSPILQTSYEESAPVVQTSNQNSLFEMLAGYQLTKALPQKVTPSNIGHSIQSLSNILKLLKKVKTHPSYTISSPDIEDETISNGVSQNYSPYQTEGSTPGKAGIDYPAYSEIPETRFSCKNQRYKGFFGDPETNCQVWHYCDLNGGQASFLCPNGTIFSQVALTCDWWFNVKCASTAQLYVLNERLYKYILPHKPSFPEDFAGPLVDQYLTQKFQELEAKKKNTTTEKPSSTLQVLLNDEINQAVK